MGTPPTETANGGARSAASPAAAGTRSPNPTQLAAAASASRTRIGILQFSRKSELVICSHRHSQSVTVACHPAECRRTETGRSEHVDALWAPLFPRTVL